MYLTLNMIYDCLQFHQIKIFLADGDNSSQLCLFNLKGNEKRLIDIKTIAALDLPRSNILNSY